MRPGSLDPRAYWRANLRVLALLLAVWLVVSLVLGIVLVRALNQVQIAGFPLGFWIAQQGSILVFVVLIFIYARWMDRVERRMHSAGRALPSGAPAARPPEVPRVAPDGVARTPARGPWREPPAGRAPGRTPDPTHEPDA